MSGKYDCLVLSSPRAKVRLFPEPYIPNADGYLSFEAFAEIKHLLDRLKEYEAKEAAGLDNPCQLPES